MIGSCVDDVKLTVADACTNAYQHAVAADTDEVVFTLDDEPRQAVVSPPVRGSDRWACVALVESPERVPRARGRIRR